MAQAAEQQSTGIEQVNVAVGQMDQVTQQNAAMVEESTAASRNLASETQALSNLVAFFTVGDVARPAAHAASAVHSQTPVQPTAKSPARPLPKAVRHSTNGTGRHATAAVARRPSAETEAEDWTEF